MRRRRAIAASFLLFAFVVPNTFASDESDYSKLPPHKALAIASVDPSVRGIASAAASDEAASMAALVQCNAALQSPSACEITRLNDVLVSSADALRARVPRGPHPLFLWRFESGASTVYLAGSIHVMKASLFPLPEQFDAAFDRSDRLVVEVNTDTLAPDALRETFKRYALLPAGESLDTVLRPQTLAAVTAYLRSQNASLNDVASLKPAMLATQLSVSRLNALGYLPELGLERHFESRIGERPVLQLETLDEQLGVLTSPSFSVQDELLAETLDQMESIEPIVAGVVVAWLGGDDKEFRRLFDLENGDSPDIIAFSRKLLEERNVGMAAKIADYLHSPGTTFVLIGAAHLTGRDSVVSLLEARGLHGERLESSETIGGHP